MRIMIAGLAAAVALAFTVPAFAQNETSPDVTPTAKPKQGTVAYCKSLKSASAKSACLKRVQAQKATPAAPKAKAKAKTPPKATPMPKPETTAAAPAPSGATAPQSTVAVPPLPQKTI